MEANFQNTRLEITAGIPAQFPKNSLPRVAFTGRSNVGKSSLINTVLSRKSLARVSSTPGKTVTVNFYNVDNVFYLVDLPGYGYAKRAPDDIKKWSSLTDGFFTNEPSASIISGVVALIDLKVGITKDDAVMLNYLNECGIRYCVAATKCDKLNKTEMQKNLTAMQNSGVLNAETEIIPFSSLKGIGKNEVISAIKKWLRNNYAN